MGCVVLGRVPASAGTDSQTRLDSMFERYLRQLDVFGTDGQIQLAKASALVVGAGGLGSGLLYNLAGLGVGKLGVVDGDHVEISNLNRQFLYRNQDLGKQKSELAYGRLADFNPEISIKAFNKRVNEENITDLMKGYDIVVTAVDNIKTRLLVNEAAFCQKIPVVDGGVDGWLGMVSSVCGGKPPCLQCFYGKKPSVFDRAPSSTSPVVTLISSLQATVTASVLLGKPNPLKNRVLVFDGRTMEFDSLASHANPHCSVCSLAV